MIVEKNEYPVGATDDDYGYHAFVDPDDGGGWYTETRQVGTTHHDAEYTTAHYDATGHYETVVTQAAIASVSE